MMHDSNKADIGTNILRMVADREAAERRARSFESVSQCQKDRQTDRLFIMTNIRSNGGSVQSDETRIQTLSVSEFQQMVCVSGIAKG